MPGSPYDLAIVGGGVNGTGIARDAAGRGLSVLLCEKNDLASGTSSASTKLIHGGLRYLEYYEFRLVRESLREREVLLAMAPHIAWPLRFVLPQHRGLRPAPILRLGLFLYDHIGGRKRLPPTRTLDLTTDPAGTPLKPEFRRAFEYSDCWVDDARLVVLNAVDARERGAVIRSRTECVGAERAGEAWRLTLRDTSSGATEVVPARALVNAAGPWVARFLGQVLGTNTPVPIRLVKGSHVVVPRLFAHERAYIFQNADGRIIFAIPYERDFTLIGTTDQDYDGDPGEARISAAERDYLCASASQYFASPVRPESVVWTYSGVRPLYDDGAKSAQAATRDYVLVLDAGDGQAARLDVYGGKITTYRRLAAQALEKLRARFPAMGPSWTAGSPLPGGDFPVEAFDSTLSAFMQRHPFLPAELALRLLRSYGTRAERIVGHAGGLADLGHHFGHGLTEGEVEYLRREEFALTADDILWRRSKLGLRFTAGEKTQLEEWLGASRSVGDRVPPREALGRAG